MINIFKKKSIPPLSEGTQAIINYHRNMIAIHGNTGAEALGWADLQSQLIRFGALLKIIQPGAATVLDAGCGHADLLPYLLELNPEITYTGIEQIPELLQEAISRYGHLPKANFIHGNFLSETTPTSDYIIASGSLNYFHPDADFIYKAIDHLYACCKIGFGFNLLRRVIPNGMIVAYNPAAVLSYCQKISSKAILTDDYSDEDFTIFMYK